MLFSKENCWKDKRRGEICSTQPFIENYPPFLNGTEMDRWEKQRKETEEKEHKKIARDKAILVSCLRVLKG
ncbi:hypothetical protein JP0136_04430 [Helicobacter pylori]